MNPVLDHVLSVLILPALHLAPSYRSPPRKGDLCHIQIYFGLSKAFAQIPTASKLRKYILSSISKNALRPSSQAFLSQLSLEALRVKEKLFELFQASHFTSFPQKDGSFMEEKMTENICKPVGNSVPQGTGIKDKQILSNMSWKNEYATVLDI